MNLNMPEQAIPLFQKVLEFGPKRHRSTRPTRLALYYTKGI